MKYGVIVWAVLMIFGGLAQAGEKTEKEVIVTYVSWKTPLGALNGNRQWQDYAYDRAKKNGNNYPVFATPTRLPEKPPVIGSPEYMKLTMPFALETLTQMKQAGIDVMLYDCMPLPGYDPAQSWSYDNIPLASYGMLPVWLEAAAETGMKIGIFVEPSNYSGDCLQRYSPNPAQNRELLTAILANLPSGKAADALWRIDGAPVIIHFATDSCMGHAPDKNAPAPDGGWRDIIKELKKNNANFYFIADIRTHTPNRQIWSEFADAVYDFSPAGPANYAAETGEEMKKYFDKLNTPYIFSSSPGYYNRKVYTEPEFKRIHNLYQSAIKNHADKIHIITWNDTVESTDIWPSHDKGHCLLDVYSYYNHWFKSGKQPAAEPEHIILAYPKVISSQITSPPLKWGGGRWTGRPYSPKVFYWANLQTPRRVKAGAAGEVLLPAGLSMGEFPGEMAVCDTLGVELDGATLSYPGVGTSDKEDLNFRYIDLLKKR